MNRRRWGLILVWSGLALIASGFAVMGFDALYGGCLFTVYGGCSETLPVPLWVFAVLVIVGVVAAGVGFRIWPRRFEHTSVL